MTCVSGDNLLMQEIGGLRNGETIRDLMEITALQFLLHANGLKEKSLASHVHMQKRQFPIALRDLRLLQLRQQLNEIRAIIKRS